MYCTFKLWNSINGNVALSVLVPIIALDCVVTCILGTRRREFRYSSCRCWTFAWKFHSAG